MRYRLLARRGIQGFVEIFEKQVLTISAQTPNEVAEKLGGKFIAIKGEQCIIFPPRISIPPNLPAKAGKRLQRWVNQLADPVKLNGEIVKLFFIKKL